MDEDNFTPVQETDGAEASTAADFAANSDDVFATSELPVPPAIPDAHQCVINGVTLETFESGATAIKIALASLNVPTLDTEMLIFLPKGFVEDIYVDAHTLPEEEGNKQQTSYRIGIANGDKNATLQQLRDIAYKAGRTPAAVGAVRARNLEEFVDNHNKLLTGVQAVFFRRADDGENADPRFKNRLRVKGILPPDSAYNPKQLKRYVKMWEQQNQ